MDNSAQALAESIVANKSWHGVSIDPPGNRKVLARLIAEALAKQAAQSAQAMQSAQATRESETPGGASFRKGKA